MDLVRTWVYTSQWQKLCFLVLFVIIVVVLVRALRLAWWLRQCTRVARGSEPVPADARRQYHKADRLARSTRGLAQVAFWLTCSGCAEGLYEAWTIIANTSRSMLAMMAEDSLNTLDATAIGLGLYALLHGTGLLFGIMVDSGARRLQFALGDGDPGALPASRSSRVGRAIQAVRYARHAIVAIASLLVAAAFIELRSRYTETLGSNEASRVAYAVYDSLHHMLNHLAVVFLVAALLTWFGVLLESALSRRQQVA